MGPCVGPFPADQPTGALLQETLAKQGVVLPHERAMQQGAAAAGSGPAPQLGAIYYERDSEEEYDSDVDPDDDLDI